MRIHSFTMFIALPFLLLGAILLYLLFFQDREDLYIYLFPIVIILASLYAFHPKIDFWWHKKNPPVLDKKLLKLVQKASPLFNNLDNSGKKRFLDRLSIFIHHKAFYVMIKEKEKMPEDMKLLIAINAISLTMKQDEYFFDRYDYFIAYHHPFPTPNRNVLHSVETNHEDGVLLFNIDLLFKNMVLGTSVFNIGTYAFTEAYLNNYPMSALAQMDEPSLDMVDQFKDIDLEQIQIHIGYKELLAKAVLVSLYFSYPLDVEKYYPEQYKIFKRELI